MSEQSGQSRALHCRQISLSWACAWYEQMRPVQRSHRMMPGRQPRKPHSGGRSVRDPCEVLFFFPAGGCTGGTWSKAGSPLAPASVSRAPAANGDDEPRRIGCREDARKAQWRRSGSFYSGYPPFCFARGRRIRTGEVMMMMMMNLRGQPGSFVTRSR